MARVPVQRSRTSLGRLLQPDGSLIVPAPVAGEVLYHLERSLLRSIREDRVQMTPGARAVLEGLRQAAEHRAAGPPGFATETEARAPGIVEITADDAAVLTGCSPQYIRRLCLAGEIPARRAGRPMWLIDRAGLDGYMRGGRDGGSCDSGEAACRAAG